MCELLEIASSVWITFYIAISRDRLHCFPTDHPKCPVTVSLASHGAHGYCSPVCNLYHLVGLHAPIRSEEKEDVRPDKEEIAECLARQGFIGYLGRLGNVPSVPHFVEWGNRPIDLYGAGKH